MMYTQMMFTRSNT